MRAGNGGPAFGETEKKKATAEALDGAVSIEKVVTVPYDRSIGARRVNPEIKAGIASEKGREAGHERLKSAKFKLGALITARIAFSARCMQNVEDEERRREALDELEQDGRVTAGDTSNKPRCFSGRGFNGEDRSIRMRYPFFRRLPIELMHERPNVKAEPRAEAGN